MDMAVRSATTPICIAPSSTVTPYLLRRFSRVAVAGLPTRARSQGPNRCGSNATTPALAQHVPTTLRWMRVCRMGQPGAGQAAQRAGTRLMSRGHSVSGAMRRARRSGRAYLRWTTIAAQIDLTAPVTLNVLDLQAQFRASPAAYVLWSLELSNWGYCLTGQFMI